MNNRVKRLISQAFGGATVEERGERDGVLQLSVAGRFGALELGAVWTGAGWPADVQRALERLPERSLGDERLVFAAQQMSPGAVRILGESKRNWADETGNASIVAPGIVVIRSAPTPDQAPASLSWSASALAVGEALLARDWSEGVRTTELANLVQWSPGRVSGVLQRFDEEGWTVKFGPQRGRGAVRELADSERLLDAWATGLAAEAREPRITHRTMRSPLDFLEGELAAALGEEVRWALSGWGAANQLAPYSDAVPSLQIYVHEEDFGEPLDRVIEGVGLADVAEGGRVSFLRAHPSVLALSASSPIGPLASSPRVYADLLTAGGRAEEAATHLREEVLDPIHGRRRSRTVPEGMTRWESACRERLGQLAASRRPELATAYEYGTWSASYRLTGVREAPSASKLLAILREVKGRETGWPVWLVPEPGSEDLRPFDGSIECWLGSTFFEDSSHADYWRADPSGRLCLIRGYQEDSPSERMAPGPGELLDLVLPIWRTGECLLHAARLAHRLDASSVQLMMRWSGLAGRRLASVADRNRWLEPNRKASQDEVRSFVELGPAEIEGDLPGVVRALVEPLYESFEFFEPAAEIYAEELARLREGDFE